MIFREYVSLKSIRTLVHLFEVQGLRTRQGKAWSRAGIAWILQNETYAGMVRFGSVRAHGLHEALVSPSTFRKAQKILRANDKHGPKKDALEKTGSMERAG
jgi:hypothetical protein